MGDEIPSALPATYFFPLVSTHPTPILLPFSLYIFTVYIFFYLYVYLSTSLHLYNQVINHFGMYNLSFWEECIIKLKTSLLNINSSNLNNQSSIIMYYMQFYCQQYICMPLQIQNKENAFFNCPDILWQTCDFLGGWILR